MWYRGNESTESQESDDSNESSEVIVVNINKVR